MIIDMHVHPGSSLFGKELAPEALLKSMDNLGIRQAVIMPPKPREYHFEPENTRIAEMAKKYPNTFIPFGRVDPWQREKAVAEIRRLFSELNFAGLFINPVEEQCPLTSPVLRQVLDAIGEYKKPVMLAGGHVRVSHPRQIEYIARAYPDITFIATSGGQINICGSMMYDAERMLKNCPNVMMETSGIYRRDFIENMTKDLGAARVLFGSGAPYYNQEFELTRITTAHISPEEKEMLLHKNAAALLKLQVVSG